MGDLDIFGTYIKEVKEVLEIKYNKMDNFIYVSSK
jgi:hypothetical protein